MTYDEDGMARWDVVGTITGVNGKVRHINHQGAHEYELENIRTAIRKAARKGDTVDVKVV